MCIRQGRTGNAARVGYEIVRDSGICVIGMSPGNSYFNKDRISDLIKFSSRVFSQAIVMVPDVPAEHTYKALGYSGNKARQKARLNGNTLQNHCKRAIGSLEDHVKDRFSVIEWTQDVEGNPIYGQAIREIKELYWSNPHFSESARRETRSVLEPKLKDSGGIGPAVQEGVWYLLKEFAFLRACPLMFDLERVAYLYHKPWGIFEDYVNGVYDGRIHHGLGFLIADHVMAQ